MYASAIIGGDEPYFVYTPPQYDAGRSEPYPILYLLHGLGDSASSWIANGGVDLTINNLLAQGRAKPLVIVMPLCSGTPSGRYKPAAFEQALFDELIPRV